MSHVIPFRPPSLRFATIAAIVRRWAPAIFFVEFAGVRSGERAVRAFAFGRSRGVIEGVLGACAVPATTVALAAWKRAVGIPAGRDGAKDLARSQAILSER